MRLSTSNAHRRRRMVMALAWVAAVITAGCSGTTVESVADRASAVEPAEQVDEVAAASEGVRAVSEPTATPAAPTVVAVAAPEPTSAPTALVIPTPSFDKNQPVFRQARPDGDSRAAPSAVALADQGRTQEVIGELSAFTDRVDAFRVTAPDDVDELTLRWSCTSYVSKDDRPLRISVERDGAVLSEFRCADAGLSGSVRVDMSAGPIVVVADIETAPGAALANMFVQYSLAIRAISSDGLIDDNEAQAADPSAEAEVTPTPTPAVAVDQEPAEQEDASATPEPESTSSPEATPGAGVAPTPEPTPTPTPEPTPAPTYVDTPTSRVAPPDGDSRTNPAEIEDDGFLIGSVSAPGGDQSDWSAFVVGPEDPTELFVGVRCDEFESPDASGLLTLSVLSDGATVAMLSCTEASLEDFELLEFDVGARYLVQAEFSGTGYTNWVFEALDAD